MKVETLYQVRIIKEFNEFLLLEEQWYLLCQSSIELCPMMTFGWLIAWWKTFGEGLYMHTITVWNKDVLIAAVPMAIKQNRWGFLQRNILTEWVNTWVDRYIWLLDRRYPDSLTCILDYLNKNKKMWDELYLQRQPIDVQQTQKINQYFNSRPYHTIYEDDLQSPLITLPDSHEALINGLSRSFRQSLKRKVRAIEKREDIKMWIAKDGTQCESAVIDISPHTWQHQQGSSMVATPEIQHFFHEVIQSAEKDNNLFAAIMTIDGEYAAFEVNIKCRDKLHNLKLGYKSKYADLSAGIVLKNFCLSRVMNNKQQNIFEYDLMGTTEAYKLNWTKQIRSHQAVHVIPKSFRNVFWAIKYQYKNWFRKKTPGLFAFMKSIKVFISR